MNFDTDKYAWTPGGDIDPYIQAKVAKDAFVRISAQQYPSRALLRLYSSGRKVAEAGQSDQASGEFAGLFPERYWPGRTECDRAVQVFLEERKSFLYPLAGLGQLSGLAFSELFTRVRYVLDEVHIGQPANFFDIYSDESATYGQVCYGVHKWVLARGSGVVTLEHYTGDDGAPSTCFSGSFGPLPAVMAADYSGNLVSASYMSGGRLHRKGGPAKVLFDGGKIFGAVWLADPKLR